jgi:hypothetical protein
VLIFQGLEEMKYGYFAVTMSHCGSWLCKFEEPTLCSVHGRGLPVWPRKSLPKGGATLSPAEEVPMPVFVSYHGHYIPLHCFLFLFFAFWFSRELVWGGDTRPSSPVEKIGTELKFQAKPLALRTFLVACKRLNIKGLYGFYAINCYTVIKLPLIWLRPSFQPQNRYIQYIADSRSYPYLTLSIT